MGQVVLDTSILVAVERGVLRLGECINENEDVAIPSIAIAEYLVGLHRSTQVRQRARIARNLEFLEELSTVLEFGEREAKAFAILQAEALNSGVGRTEFDLAIAAHSVVQGAILVTRDKNARLSELTGVVTREV